MSFTPYGEPTLATRRAHAAAKRGATTIVFREIEMAAIPLDASSPDTGTHKLSSDSLGPLIASAEGVGFSVSPLYFEPYTLERIPVEDEEFTWHNYLYRITKVTFGDHNQDTIGVEIYGYRKVVL